MSCDPQPPSILVICGCSFRLYYHPHVLGCIVVMSLYFHYLLADHSPNAADKPSQLSKHLTAILESMI